MPTKSSCSARTKSAIKHVRWRQIDDLRLVNAVQRFPSLLQVYRQVKFSRPYSLREVEERWKALLYDTNVSCQYNKTRNNPNSRLKVDNDLPVWSLKELDVITNLGMNNPNPTRKDFEKIMEKYALVFDPTRTAKQVYKCWKWKEYLKSSRVREDKSSNETADQQSGNKSNSSSDSVSLINMNNTKNNDDGCYNKRMLDLSLKTNNIDVFEELVWNTSSDILNGVFFTKATDVDIVKAIKKEINCNERVNRQKIRKLEESVSNIEFYSKSSAKEKDGCENENEIEHIVNYANSNKESKSAASDSEAKARTQILGVLKGMNGMEYLMKTQVVLIGRGDEVDVDLSIEGPAFNISRKQMIIELSPDLNFYLKNISKKCVYINGYPLQVGNVMYLNDKALIEVGHLQILFYINTKLLGEMRKYMHQKCYEINK